MARQLWTASDVRIEWRYEQNAMWSDGNRKEILSESPLYGIARLAIGRRARLGAGNAEWERLHALPNRVAPVVWVDAGHIAGSAARRPLTLVAEED